MVYKRKLFVTLSPIRRNNFVTRQKYKKKQNFLHRLVKTRKQKASKNIYFTKTNMHYTYKGITYNIFGYNHHNHKKNE